MDAYKEMGAILKEEGFDDDIIETFQENKIDVKVFVDLDRVDFTELGIKAVGDKRKLLQLQEKIKSEPPDRKDNTNDETLSQEEPNKHGKDVVNSGKNTTEPGGDMSDVQKDESITSMQEPGKEEIVHSTVQENLPKSHFSLEDTTAPEKPTVAESPEANQDEAFKQPKGSKKCQKIMIGESPPADLLKKKSSDEIPKNAPAYADGYLLIEKPSDETPKNVHADDHLQKEVPDLLEENPSDETSKSAPAGPLKEKSSDETPSSVPVIDHPLKENSSEQFSNSTPADSHPLNENSSDETPKIAPACPLKEKSSDETPSSVPVIDHPLKENSSDKTPESVSADQQPKGKSSKNTERTTKEDYIGFSSVPDLEIIENVSDDVKKKWRALGLQLNLTRMELKQLERKPFRESFSLVLSLWSKKASKDHPFTWDTFFTALSSNEINEAETVEQLLAMLTEYQSSDEEQFDEITPEDNTSGKSLQHYIKPYDSSTTLKLPPNIRGLTTADCVHVTFHVIINPNTWKLQKKFELFIASVSCSTNGKYLIGPLENVKGDEEEQLYAATLPIPFDFISGNYFKYKYTVLQRAKKKKMRRKERVEEDLCIATHEWRVIILQDLGLKQKYLGFHFDPLVLPPYSVGFLQSYGIYGSSRDPLIESTRNALRFYLLHGFETLGWLSIDSHMTSDDIMNKGNLISLPYLCLKNQRRSLKHGQKINSLEFNDDYILEKTLLSELSKAIEQLHCLEKFYCALIISDALIRSNMISTHAVFKADITATKEILRGFQMPVHHSDSYCMFAVRDSHHHGHFEDCILFFRDMNSEIRDIAVIPTVTTLCKILVNDKDLHYEWMGALPILHVLKGSSLERMDAFPTSIDKVYDLLFCGILTYSFQSKVIRQKTFAEDSFHFLRPYFDVDWLLPRAWVSMIPFQELQRIKHLPSVPPYACWHVGIKLKSMNKIANLDKVILVLMVYINAYELNKKDNKICFKGANNIMRFCENENEKSFMTSLELYLRVLKKIGWEDIQYIRNCTESIKTWIKRTYGNEMIPSRVDTELENWDSILRINQEVDCFQEILSEDIQFMLSFRLSQLEIKRKVEIIMGGLAKDQCIKESVIHSFLNSAPHSVNDTQQLLSFIKQIGYTQETLVVLGGIVSSVFRTESEVTLQEVFWKFFPECLEIYERCLQRGYTFNAEQSNVGRIFEKAKDELQNLFSGLKFRNLTLKELDEIVNYGIHKIEVVFSSFLKLQCFQENAKFISIKTLQMEIQAYWQLKEKKKKILHFAHKSLEFAEEESTKIKEFLSADHSSNHICDIWKFDEHTQSPIYLFPELHCAPEDIIDQIFCFTSSEGCCSKIFQSRWTNSKKRYVQKLRGRHISIDEFVNDLWIPVISDFHEDLEALSNELKLPLEKVTELFDEIRERKALEHELEEWCSAFKTENRTWIRSAAQKILDYQELTYYAKSAHTLMQLKKTLKLTGDFNILTNLLQSEKESSAVEEITLASVNIAAKETVGVLKDIAEHPLRRKCLEVFCSCTELVEWIRKMAKNVGQLAEVVQISNQTMEGDMVKQLLSDLLVFGSAYAPLIYEIRPDESCESLVNRCKSLWTFLDKHPDLDSIAKLCNERLGEFRRIEEALTDFQKSNVEQMNTINMKGIYAISAIPGKIHHSTEEAVHLRLRDLENEKERKVYSLSDLKELQSRLVLVAAENADSVNRFIEILSKVERVAELLIKLQESGYIDYTHYKLQFGCSQYKKKDIDEHISKLEKTLLDWKKSVQSHRKKYPQLNYYTSQQLLDLQQEFGKLKKDKSLQASCKLMLLLLSVTSNPNNSKISQAIKLSRRSHSTSDGALKCTISLKPIATLGHAEKKLNFGDLGDKEKEVYSTLTSVDEYHPALVLRAFEACPNKANVDDMRLWCMDNESKFNEDESEIFVPENVSTEEHDGVEVTADDPLVKELLDEDYDLNIAIEAVKLSKTTNINMREAVLSLDLGKSPQARIETGWSLPSKFTQVPFSVKVDVPRDEYLTLVELGCVLQELSCTVGEVGGLIKERPLRQRIIERGTHSVIVTDEVWKTVLYLYMYDNSLPLPTNEEIVVCTEATSVEEVTLLWHRAVNDENKYRIFTLVNGEKLPYKICEEVLNNLEFLTQGSSDFKIAIVINSGDQSREYICSRLASYVRHVPTLPPDDEVTKYIISHTQSHLPKSKGSNLSTDEKNISRNLERTVQTVVSTLPGMGKSLRVKRYAEILKKNYMSLTDQEKPHYVCVPIHGPEISLMMLIEQLEECKQDPINPFPQIIHFNIANSILEKIDWLLFQILILGSLSDRYGNVWKKVPTQICVIECTLSKLQDARPGQWNPTDSNMKQLPSTYSLLSLLPQTLCVSPKTLEIYCLDSGETGDLVLFDESVFKEEKVQRVYQYQKRFEHNVSNLDNYYYSKLEGNIKECLSTILRAMSSANMKDEFDPSWSQIGNFITFLNAQLSDCEESIFCRFGGNDFKGFKEFIVRFSIVMAKEFTEPSMDIGKGFKDVPESNIEDLYSVIRGKSWNECAHPYLFFNQDEGRSMTFMGLWIDEQGNLIHYLNGQKEIAQTHYMDRNLRSILARNGVQFMEEYDKLGKIEMLQKLIRLLGINEREFMTDEKLDLKKLDPDESYVLTLDNLMKMLAIHMKFRCGIPVIMMGETGCGKTRLLRYLCEIQDNVFKTKTLSCLKVHGGTNEERIIQEVEKAKALAEQNKKTCGKHIYTVLFFDEVNTTEALDLIKEIICDRTLYGKPIPDEIKFAAACNPYRVHDEETLRSLQSAGLGFYLRDEERIPKLGNIPLRKLVYRVLPLPPSMNQYVYDFGTVSGKSEGKYIKRIIINQIADCRHIKDHEISSCQKLLVNVLEECQAYMRDQRNECRYVSLRDVVRAMALFNFFFEKLRTVEMFKDLLNSLINDDSQECQVAKSLSDITRALIFSIYVCYYARLHDKSVSSDGEDNDSHIKGGEKALKTMNHRKLFMERILPKFGNDYIKLDSLESKTMFFEDEILRVQTIFLNAMNVPSNIAHNAALRENVFMMAVCIENRLPLFIVGKPGSSKSLAKSIVANSMQGQYSTNKFLTYFKQIQLFPYQCNQFSTTETLVEVFEEAKAFQKRQKDYRNFASVVVLEEIGLAEDTPGLPLKVLHPYLEDGTAGINPDDQDVRPEERVAFIGISNWALDPAKMNRGIMVTRSSPPQEELLKSAYGIAKMIKDDLIRDELSKSFDGLAEMYRRICRLQEAETDNGTGNDEAREFFGLRDFYTMIKMLCWKCIDTGRCPQPEDFRYVILRNFSGHSLIDPLKQVPNASSLISTVKMKNEELNIIQTSLEPLILKPENEGSKRDNRYLLFITENQSALGILRTHLLKDDTPYIFYGSSFPKDKDYTQVCVNINKIKVCMERGIPVILLNYEQIYESLYDVLNQCYTELHTGRYVDLGLRSYKIKCRVHSNFRLVIIAEKSRVFTQFPTALINRMEKHLLVSKTILTSTQQELLVTLEDWAKRFSSIKSNEYRFTTGDAFVGYQEDTAATILLCAIDQLPKDRDETEIMKYCREMQLQLASSDALARLCSQSKKLHDYEVEEAFDVYFEKQEHFNLSDFLQNYLRADEHFETGKLMQITTFGPLLVSNKKLQCGIDDIHIYHISEFDTEIDFSRMLSEHFEADKKDPRLLIIQCEWEGWNTDLIACARHRVQDETIKASSKGITHVLFVIQLARVTGGSSFTSFQGYPWICVHIDDLTSPQGTNKLLKTAFTRPIQAFFQFLVDHAAEVPPSFKVCNRIKDNIQISLAKTVSYNTYEKMESLIEVLFSLIDDSAETKDMPSFTTCLLLWIQSLLQQRDEELVTAPDKWAIEAALDKSKLQTNLTLVNSIKRFFDAQLQKILSYIIVHLNINQNIDLFASSTSSCLKKLWLNLFSKENFFQLSYQDTLVPSLASFKNLDFQSKFPFSWEVIDQINTVFNKLISHNEGTPIRNIFKNLIAALELLAFAESINSIPYESSGEFYEHYLNDYLWNLQLPFKDSTSAYKILHKAVVSVSCLLEPAIEQNSPYPLLNGIVSIHLAYHSMEKEVFYFTELCARYPKLPSLLQDEEIFSSGKVVFHVLGMSKVIEKTSPDERDWNAETMKEWLHSYHEIRNVVETILNLQDEYDEQTQLIINSCRVNWQKTQAVVLLAEHVVVNITYTDLYVFLKRYNNILKSLTFTQPDILTITLRQIQALLRKLPVKQQPKCELCQDNLKLKSVIYLPCGNNHILCESCFNDSLKKRGPRCPCCNEPIPRNEKFEIPEAKKREYELLRSAQQNCMDFFIELVSQCCFSSLLNTESPSEEFLEQLLKIITDTENEEYKQLFPLDEEYSHSCPIARSVLLQELLERKPEQVKRKLQEYQKYIKSTLGYISDDQQLALLCIKSIEDGLHKQCHLKLSLDERLEFAEDCLSMAFKQTLSRGDLIKDYRASLSIQYMECIAQVRFGLCFASTMFYRYYCSQGALQNLPSSTKNKLEQLRVGVRTLIRDGVITEPRDFLIKQLVRQYGFTYLDVLAKHEGFKEWITEKVEGEVKNVDEFVVCGSSYQTLRAKWCYTDISDESSKEELQEKPIEHHVTVCLTLFRRLLTRSDECKPPSVFTDLRKEMESLVGFSENFLETILGGTCDLSSSRYIFSPWETQTTTKLSTVVVHFAALVAIQSQNHCDFFYPFVNILKDGTDLKDCFWPAMPDSILDIVMGSRDRWNTGSWWQCENGHLYFIGDCGNPINPGDEGKRMTYTRCHECGVPIGGRHLREDRRLQVTERSGRTEPGHCLDPSTRRSSIPTSQRDLSPVSNCIVMILVHASCIWAASSKKFKNLLQSLTRGSEILDEEVLTFFWNHFEKDFETFSRATQLSFDDCILVVHSVIHSMLEAKVDLSNVDSVLKSRQQRQIWEKEFDRVFIKPVTTNLESTVQAARDLVIDDCNKDHKKLYQMIYEKANYDQTDKIDPHLWIYRPIITIDHVAKSLQQLKDSVKTDLTILQEFLKNVDYLVALQYLPDIVQMQSTLHEICNHRIDEREAQSMSMESFIHANIPKAYQREKLFKEVKSFCTAWNRVREQLPKQMMVPLDKKYASEEITPHQPLAYFIPLDEGSGVCSVALATYLAKLQNDFIETSWKKLAKSEHSTFKVPIQRIQESQIIKFEQQLTNVIFSHCKYSLKAGHGSDVTYDYAALEKHILDRFVRGKPLIDIAFPGMSYRSDVIKALTFRKIRRTINQEQLPQRDKGDILLVVRSNQRLQECIDVVNVALAFIQYGSWQPHFMLKRCFATLKLDRKLPKIIEDRCQVKHLISLWRALNVEKARQLTKGKEDPFKDVNPAFKEPLNKEMEELLKKELGPYDIDQFLDVFYEFITTHIKTRSEVEAEEMLVESYIDVCDFFELEKIKNFEERFPKEFSLKHVVSIWKYAIHYKEKHQY